MSEKIILDEAEIIKQISRDAKAVNIPVEPAKEFAKEIAHKVLAWAKKRSVITEADLNRKLASEAKKYNPDLAYVYENRDKII